MFKNQKGFTLIELILVVMIIGIFAVMLISGSIASKNRAKDASTKSMAVALQIDADAFARRHGGRYPTSIYQVELPPPPKVDFPHPWFTLSYNVFTKKLTEPSNGSIKGSTGYWGRPDGSTYLIYGIGYSGDTLVKLTPGK